MPIYNHDELEQFLKQQARRELAKARVLQLLPENLILDLGLIPTEPPGLKASLLEWIIEGNSERFKEGEPMLVTKRLVYSCPIWQLTPIPIVSLSQQRGLLQPPKRLNNARSQTINQRKR